MRGLKTILFLVLAGTLLQAQVFWRRPRNLPADWTRGYQTPVQVQEGRGDLQMFAVEGSLEQIHTDLLRHHGDTLVWMPGEHVAWAIALESGWLTRYLVQPNTEAEGFWVFSLRQRERDAGRPGAKPRQHQLREIATFPQSEPSFFSKDEGNLTTLEISTTPAPPDAVLAHLQKALTEQGWQASPLNTGGMRMFLRRDQLALVGATRGKDGQTRVLRLHKPLGVD